MWSRSQDITAEPGFASHRLEKGLAAPAACVGVTVSLGAVWFASAAGELPHSSEGSSLGAWRNPLTTQWSCVG